MASDQGSATHEGDPLDPAALLRRAQDLRLSEQVLSEDTAVAERAARQLMWQDDSGGGLRRADAAMINDRDLLLLADVALGGPIVPDAARALLARPDLLRILSLEWHTQCPPAAVLEQATALERDGEDALAELVRTAHAGTCPACAVTLGPGSAAEPWAVDDRELARVVTEWRLDLVLSTAGARGDAGPAGGLDARAASGELRIPTLADAGVHPRLVWRKEGTGTTVLVLAFARLEPDDDDAPVDPAPRLVATVEEDELAEWTAFEPTPAGHFEARIVLRPDDDRVVLPLRLRLADGSS